MEKSQKAEKTKETILASTIAMIQEGNGEVEKITIRKIAERSGASVGLVNHYFGTKDYLIETCVQQMIHEVVHGFRVERWNELPSIKRTKEAAKAVMDFLMENPQISKISILGDMKKPATTSNTIGTAIRFAFCLAEDEVTESQKQQAFALTTAIQGAFLQKEIMKETIGIDFYKKKSRDEYIEWLVDQLVS
ncbi:TetR/AcrR family transcriptional regulator [Anaerosporobacter faecicola]|uniref:TetR/AcrR family transcriptional regulator n=1 Tax=Anaerosporobacter faecicola TaxID=2718714 RepID=UPI00143A8CE3|nr:TetR/AcrR family transcriptional regulator [Anaerosporobacter faecicola]